MSAIEPRILRWARETAGLSTEDAARALGLVGAKGRTGAERLAAMERGEEAPRRAVLAKMAKSYHRPLVVFYLAEPPKASDRGEDFRTLPGADRFNPEVDALVREIQARQGLIRSMLEDDEAEPLEFVGSATMETPARALAARIVELLGFRVEEFRARKSLGEAFAYLRERIEASGVYVLLVGNLGSHHTNIPVEQFRGFALSDRIAPLMVINDQDAKSAWAFTALHELAHLWLGQTGISGADGENRAERYCNDVAGEILLPGAVVRQLESVAGRSVEVMAEGIGRFAEEHRVSRAMAAYRLYRAGVIGKAEWGELERKFRDEYFESQGQEAERRRTSEGGPNYYVVRRHRVGPSLLRLVRRSLDEGTISYTKASRVLGVNPRSVERLLTWRGAR